MIKHELINADCLDYLKGHLYSDRIWDTAFADPPDNIGTKYKDHKDRLAEDEYARLLQDWLIFLTASAKTVWFSYNSKWDFRIGAIVNAMSERKPSREFKKCVQTFTFGQHNHHDLGNNYRPLLRIRRKDAPLFPDAIRVPSWRQKHGDKRADPRGRVPGDVFDFPRVTGNSKQRRAYHPTQIHEGLVERCIKLTTPPDGTVLDPFAGTGTTLRVCKRLEMPCTLIEIDKFYCQKIFEEHQQGDLARGSLEWN